ncbi:hypothetical protein TL16_g12642 [Triparma laevis f. inornata]|uniref:Inositol polyphosphate-related phosphatase domain-containing protein n=1 Tax=Triparma laevis f. inornata TaxID=1714386 RepID=A0A9W7EX25_9STRA|nr:hypothetical protein TL16_g12642 [Triparma laevis f. inornata]
MESQDIDTSSSPSSPLKSSNPSKPFVDKTNLNTSPKTSSYIKQSLSSAKTINLDPTKGTDWKVAIEQAKAYKSFKKQQSLKSKERLNKEYTPNTKAKKDDESLQRYREWKEQQKKKVLGSVIAEKKEKLKKERSPLKEKPETPAKEEQVNSAIVGKDFSFSTSASANFLSAMMNVEAAISPIKMEESSPPISPVKSPKKSSPSLSAKVSSDLLGVDKDAGKIFSDDDDSDEDNDIVESSNALLASIRDGSIEEKQAWPEALTDKLVDGAIGALPKEDAGVLQGVKDNGKVLVRVITWNQQAKKPPSTEDLRKALFRENKYHIIVVGTEECENSIAKSIVVHSKKNWEEAVVDACGDKYIKLRSHTLQATHNMVMVHRALLPLLSQTNSLAIATGHNVGVISKQQLGNKGGIGISFCLGKTSFLFINAHLAAHQNASEKRNEEFERISREVVQGLKPNGGDFDCAFWAGDMNYRINGTRQVVDVLLAKEMHDVMIHNDQLSVAMQTNPVFEGYAEGPLNFKPTYKFDKGSDNYDTSKKKRIPSWTDRILWKKQADPDAIKVLSYASANDIKTSDHRPVYGSFECKLKGAGENDFLAGGGAGAGAGAEGDHEIGLAKSQVCSVM